jgi:DnaJ-domain-containing protein 1
MTKLTDREKELIKCKKQYLNLVNQITRLQLSGKNVPEELVKKAQQMESVAEVPETFLKSILS